MICLPSWQIFNSHPSPWQPPVEETFDAEGEVTTEQKKQTDTGKKQKKKKPQKKQ